LQSEWREEEKILSVRDLGAELAVNPNTVMRSYEKLQQDEIIYNKRGIGFFVVPDAISKIKSLRKTAFMANELQQTLYTAKLLGITEQEVIRIFLSPQTS
jgi:DNA-binding transcriptional regulator YhcF (GntR family)